ncbi:transglutaminase family protein [Ktedonosporobacter rubrisoli]|uniref:Transglutaminase family protein n=1 Tax=Ktedonosporobacter rubrisoli TaxID=2509675 RepID=A0A4P6JQ43_KTERU|nr:transglutaminase family protein [Ktedonosporobacter rubrisoli]QBD77527.1 transglutaminase family protein [Ktedonosporobacter rubrisoli]
MQQDLFEHYRAFSQFTYPGLYQERLQRDLPVDIGQAGRLIKQQVIHSLSLSASREGGQTNPAYGNIGQVPWYRQGEDDYFPTATAMLAELCRRDPRGFVSDRAVENKLIITCRFVAILMASILKARGIPDRVRTGYAPYIRSDRMEVHWITQYWYTPEQRWITIDADTSLEKRPFDPFDMPPGTFNFAAHAWLAVRKGQQDASAYIVDSVDALENLATQVFFDFHCLMNNEITYMQAPIFIAIDFKTVGEEKLQAIDTLANLMQHPDENFAQLKTIWETKHEFRLLHGSLV